MKIKSILASMLAISVLATSCSEEKTGNGRLLPGDYDAAYMSIKVVTPTGAPSSRAGSGEQSAEAYENTISSLYAITFDATDKVVHHAKEPAVQALTGTMSAPNAMRVSASAEKILLVANPGTEMMKVLNSAHSGQTFASLDAAITLAYVNNTAAKPEVLVNEIRKAEGNKNATVTYSNFTMINSDELVEIEKVYVVGTEYPTEEAAKEAANKATSKQTIKIERLTAKIIVKEGTNVAKPVGSSFVLHTDFWTLDVMNSMFYPYAEKTQLTGVPHPGGGFYANAFYTEDPNFDGHLGLKYNNLVGATMAPNVTWMATGKADYCIENTMEGEDQLFKNATRLIIRATYYPDASWTGDWYRYAGTNYKTLEALKADYETVKNALPTEVNNYKFKTSCENFFKIVKAKNPTVITAVNFSGLTQTMLDNSGIVNGGEVIKDPDGCVRWYQDGLNYYYYEIRHDNTNDTAMNFGKYGVVRNNYYSLTLNKVTGPGTPWYPSVNPEPNPKDPYDPDDKPEYPDPQPDPDPEPKPTDPIDQSTGFISFEVSVGPWIYWENGIEI